MLTKNNILGQAAGHFRFFCADTDDDGNCAGWYQLQHLKAVTAAGTFLLVDPRFIHPLYCTDNPNNEIFRHHDCFTPVARLTSCFLLLLGGARLYWDYSRQLPAVPDLWRVAHLKAR